MSEQPDAPASKDWSPPSQLRVFVVQLLQVAVGDDEGAPPRLTDHAAVVLGAFCSEETADLFVSEHARMKGLEAAEPGEDRGEESVDYLRHPGCPRRFFKYSVSGHDVLSQRHETVSIQMVPRPPPTDGADAAGADADADAAGDARGSDAATAAGAARRGHAEVKSEG